MSIKPYDELPWWCQILWHRFGRIGDLPDEDGRP
jgi:hypothetical protein